MKTDVFLSLGSNRDNPVKNLENALEKLKALKTLEVVAVSTFYVTTPVDFAEQADFINCAVWVKTSMNPHKFLKVTQDIENEIGKGKEFQSGPRRIDIDIVLFGDLVIISDELRIPHSKMHKRKFVLVPMVELKKDFIHPEINQTMEELLTGLPFNPLIKVEPLKK